MAKQSIRPMFTFVNPNTPEAFAQLLRKILIEKLLSSCPDNGYV